MTTIQLLATISAATFTAYVIAGVATYIAVPAALRGGPATVVLILGWPVLWFTHDIAHNIIRAVEVGDDDRAQMGPTPIWIPGLLTGLVILAIVLNELVLGIVPAQGPLAAEYAHDPTSQFVLLAVAVTALALTKVVGWYRRRGSGDA